MTIHYGILFQLGIAHDFYQGGTDLSVIIQPSYDTQILMKNYRVLSKMNRGKLEIAAEAEMVDGNSVLSERIQEPMELWFTLRLTDSYWSNYTDFLPSEKHIYFFSNKSNKETDEDILLHSGERASEENEMELIGTTTLELPGDASVTLKKQGISEDDRTAAIISVQDKQLLQTKSLDEGIYTLTVDGQERNFIHLKNNANVHGAVQILVDPSSANDIVASDWTLQSPEFKIHFKNRSTFWRYLISSKEIEHFQGLRITNGSSESPFGEPEQAIGPDGKERLLFASSEPLSITSKPTQFLQLKKNMNIENRSEGVVIDRLPVPNKENLYRVGEDGTILTDLFINL
ncbi:MAG: hypothetical protein NXI10_14565 [bacterium]|nr:hypothetical protein [bacterium]